MFGDVPRRNSGGAPCRAGSVSLGTYSLPPKASPRPMDASIVVCTCNRAELLRNMLRSLGRVRVPPGTNCELVVVDNASTDGTRHVVEEARELLGIPMHYVLEKRRGKSRALNAGIAAARGEILLFTDDDVTFEDAWIEGILGPFTDPDVSGVGGRIVPVWETDPPEWFAARGPLGLMSPVVELDLGDEQKDMTTPPFGANMAYRRDVFARHGTFREDLGPGGGGGLLRGEDSELAWRVLGSSQRIVYAPDAVVLHPVDPRRATKEYYRDWYYDWGRAEARIVGAPEGAVLWLGVPRYLFRQLAGHVVGWLTETNRNARFVRWLNVRKTLGAIQEFRDLRRR